ncbi:MAG: hypothetical protein AB1635_21775 [Acidobacteriota bacterium]
MSRPSRALVLAVVGAIILAAAGAAAAQDTMAVDPIRCWWMSSTGAVTVGQTFTVRLTCAVVDTPDVQVVPDETRLGPGAVQFAPFEVLAGEHPADLRSGGRRFFQYVYTLRVINPDVIGTDRELPALAIHYRVQSRTSANEAIEGRDLMYIMPPLAIRVLSQVPASAVDIRDAGDGRFAQVASLRFRATLVDVAAYAAAALGLLLVGLSVAALVRGTRTAAPKGPPRVSDRAVLSRMLEELDRTPDDAASAARALAAVRVVAAVALGRHVRQHEAREGDETPAGAFRIGRGWLRRGAVYASASTTALDVAQGRQTLPANVRVERRRDLEALETSLATLTRAAYAAEPGEADLGTAVQAARDAARRARAALLSPRALLQRFARRGSLRSR